MVLSDVGRKGIYMYSLTIELFGGTVTIEHEDFSVLEVMQEFVETQEASDWEAEYYFEYEIDEWEDEEEDELLIELIEDEE